jgi:hypothetical protein
MGASGEEIPIAFEDEIEEGVAEFLVAPLYPVLEHFIATISTDPAPKQTFGRNNWLPVRWQGRLAEAGLTRPRSRLLQNFFDSCKMVDILVDDTTDVTMFESAFCSLDGLSEGVFGINCAVHSSIVRSLQVLPVIKASP